MTKFAVGDPCYANGEPGTILELIDRYNVRVKMDVQRLSIHEESVIVEEARFCDLAEFTSMDRYCISGTDPAGSPYGYIITEDGTIHSLIKQWCHGMICAMLFPELAAAQGYRQPDKLSSVYHYQRFELDNQGELPLVRIAYGMMTPINVSKGRKAATPIQMDATRRCLLEGGATLQSTIACNLRDMTMRELLKRLSKEDKL